VVAIDDSAGPDTTHQLRIGNLPPFTLTALTAFVAGAATVIVMAANGFSENGLRLGSQTAWRFAFFVFFAALVAGPLCRVTPFGLCRALGPKSRQLIWSFCAALCVFLASIIVPNTLGPQSLHHEGLTAGMMLFVVFCGVLTATMAYAATAHASREWGDKPMRAIRGVGMAYFWLTYALTGLSHISGPNRPDMFYGLSLGLMIVALSICFADRFLIKWRGLDSAL
jgi:hypothetical protein